MKSRTCFVFMPRSMIFAVGISILSATITFADKLYFTLDTGANDTLMKVDGLTPGVMEGGLGSQPGFKAVATGTDQINDIDAAIVNGIEIVATAGEVIHTWDAEINFVNVADPTGPADNNPVREIAIGEIGGNPDRIVIARETATGNTDILLQFFEASTLVHQFTPGPHNNIGNASGLALGDFDANSPGREVVVSSTELATLNKTPGFQLYVRGDNGNWLNQQPLNQPISDVAAGDLLVGLNNDEAVFTGNIGGDAGSGYGQQSHVFSTTPNLASMDFQLENAGGGPHGPPPGGLLFNAVDIGQLDADPELEIALVGNDVVRVLNHDGSFVFQTGPTTQNFVDVVIADAMDNDGVNEIVAVSDSGFVFAYDLAGGLLGYFSGGAPFTAVTSLGTETETGPITPVAEVTWLADRAGDWNLKGNWSPSVIPNGTGVTAVFGDAINETRTVFTNDNVTIQSAQFVNPNRYVIAGSGSVTFETDTSAPKARMDVFVGDHEFQTPVSLNSDMDATIGVSASLTFNNRLDLQGNTLTLLGDGTLNINNNLTTGGGTVVVNVGMVAGKGSVGGDLNNHSGIVSPGSGVTDGDADITDFHFLASNGSDTALGVPEPTGIVPLLMGFCFILTSWLGRRS